MAAKKKPSPKSAKKPTKSNSKKKKSVRKIAPATKATKKKIPKKKLAVKKAAPKLPAAKKHVIKKSAAKAPVAPPAARKKPSARQPLPPRRYAPETDRASSAGQSGDLQGLSRNERANSESVDELIEEGNAFEADAVKGVEDAGDHEEEEVHTHEMPEDDVPEEYIDEE